MRRWTRQEVDKLRAIVAACEAIEGPKFDAIAAQFPTRSQASVKRKLQTLQLRLRAETSLIVPLPPETRAGLRAFADSIGAEATALVREMLVVIARDGRYFSALDGVQVRPITPAEKQDIRRGQSRRSDARHRSRLNVLNTVAAPPPLSLDICSIDVEPVRMFATVEMISLSASMDLLPAATTEQQLGV